MVDNPVMNDFPLIMNYLLLITNVQPLITDDRPLNSFLTDYDTSKFLLINGLYQDHFHQVLPFGDSLINFPGRNINNKAE